MLIKNRHNGRTIAEQAVFMLQRMWPSSAVSMALRYSENAGDDTPIGDYWGHVAITLGRYRDGELTSDDLAKQVQEMATMSRRTPQNTTTPISRRAAAQQQAAQAATNSGTPPEEWLRRLVVALAGKVDRAKGMIDKFKADLETNASYAMEWSLSAFEAVAEHHVYKWALTALTDEHGAPQFYRPAQEPAITGKDRKSQPEFVHEFARRELVRRAASPHRSTSATSNLLEQCLLAAYAELLDLLDNNLPV